MKTPSLRLVLLTLAFSLLAAAGGRAMFMMPELVPVERLLKSADAYLAKNPNDAEAHYLLGRVHYLAFVAKRDSVPGFRGGGEPNGKPNVIARHMQGYRTDGGGKGAALTEAQMIEHATKAQAEFKEAMKLAPKDGLYALGQASLLEEIRTWSVAAKPAGLPADLKDIKPEQVWAAYAHALIVGMEEDGKMKAQPITGLPGIASYETAQALIRLGKDAKLSEEEKGTLKKAEAAVAKFQKLPMEMVTPIVFSFQPAAHLDEMLDKTRTVDFNLRGYGPRERWTWVKPELGLLVWDPLERGEVKSAQQLFGGYTFQIFRRTGYDAMAALDDNADGALAGSELDGISVWFDRDGDGRSTSEEVTTLRELNVESIAVTFTTQDGAHPMNPRGLLMKDGRVLPTWDWMVEPQR